MYVWRWFFYNLSGTKKQKFRDDDLKNNLRKKHKKSIFDCQFKIILLTKPIIKSNSNTLKISIKLDV